MGHDNFCCRDVFIFLINKGPFQIRLCQNIAKLSSARNNNSFAPEEKKMFLLLLLFFIFAELDAAFEIFLNKTQ